MIIILSGILIPSTAPLNTDTVGYAEENGTIYPKKGTLEDFITLFIQQGGQHRF